MVGFIPFPVTATESATAPFKTIEQKNAEMELGESKLVKMGSDGKKEVNIKAMQNFWGWLLGLQSFGRQETSSTITQAPVDKIVAHGTKKYQYMLCSDGSSRYYTDEQFKDENTGFTSKSQDFCKDNNQGYKVSLSNSDPSDAGTSSVNRSTNTTQPDIYEADKINREVEKLKWCNEQDEKIGNEYIVKVQQAQATQGITNEEFNAIVDPAYWKYSHNIGLLKASGCTISNVYPNYVRQ